MDFHTFLIQLLNGVQYGLLLFLVSSGLTLVFGIMGIINIAHGSFYMIGAYLAWSLTGALGNFWVALPAGIVLSVVLGMLLEWLVIRYLYGRDLLYQVLLTYGLILVFEEMRSLLGDFRDLGGEGMEVVSGSHSPEQYREFGALAKEHGLLASRASDFHGPRESRADLGSLPDLPPELIPVWQRW